MWEWDRQELPDMAFETIPVIDLKAGKAVRAVAGDRANYQPLATPLCPDGAPLACVTGFLALHPFRRLYVADLDAIEGGARQDATLAAIREAFPSLELWVDAGFTGADAATDWQRLGLGRPVLGSESLRDPRPRLPLGSILSLDFRGEDFLGPPSLLKEPKRWPADIIVMSLHSVGAGRGPDVQRLTRIVAAAGGARVYAAGGVRGEGDLQTLARIGAAGALIASALHGGALTSASLAI
jgi:uncharacterized protein related to proFAR isomerase